MNSFIIMDSIMPLIRRMYLGDVFSDLWHKMNRRKTVGITLLGVARMIGGVYMLTGVIAQGMIGHDVIFSFFLAGFTSILAAFCYVEPVRVPKANSAYAFTYVFMSEYVAFFVGWSLILQHILGAASSARVWSGYVDYLVNGAINNYTRTMDEYTVGEPLSNVPDFLASGICLAYALFLGLAVKTLMTINSVLIIINLIAMGVIIVMEIYYADLSHWRKTQNGSFMPFDFSYIIKGAAMFFYANIGFDSIVTSGEEVHDPHRSIPLATLFCTTTAITGYILIGAALTPFWVIDPTAIFPEAFLFRNITWSKYIISIGAFCGMSMTLFVCLFYLSRTMYSMANDGLLFSFFGHINKRTYMPVCNVIISGLFGAVIALLFDNHHLIELMSFATLITYIVMAIDVIMLKYGIISDRARCTVDAPNSFSSSSTKEADSNNYNSIASVRSEMLCEGIGKFQLRYACLKNWFTLHTSKYVVPISLLIYTSTCLFIGAFVRTAFETSCECTFVEHLYMWMYFIILLVVSISIIAVHKQNPSDGKFQVLLVPLIPALSILFNINLVMQLSLMTSIQFAMWTTIGIIIYFLYGIHYSKEVINISN